VNPNLKTLLERLLAHEIDFVLIGGFAAVVHGATLVTQDVDICMAITENSVTRLREALKDLHPWHRMNPTAKLSFAEHPVVTQGTNNIYLKTDLGVLDVLSEAQPAGNFDAIKRRSVEIPLYGHRCKVISIEDLIQVKEAMSRPKDQQAAQELKLIQRKSKN
jgi:hypothetical protein